MSPSFKEKVDDFVFIAISIVFLIGAPIYIVKKHFAGEQVALMARSFTFGEVSGFILLSLAVTIVLSNIHLAFIRPQAYKKRYGCMEGYRFISGLPMAGSVILLASAVLIAGNYLIGAACLLLLFIDPAGIPWTIWRLFREFLSKN